MNVQTTAAMPAVNNIILNAFNHQVYDLNNMDVQHMQLYDSVVVAASATPTVSNTSFFSNVGPASNKTVADTNLSTNRLLTAPEAFSIMSFRIRWQEDILLADLIGVLKNYNFEFYIGKKIYQQAPIWNFNAGGGIYGVSDVSSTSVFTNGYPGREAMHRLNIPLVIDNTAQFYGQLNGGSYTLTSSGSGGTGMRLTLMLDGFWARGIQ
jgi:hypothetical protein